MWIKAKTPIKLSPKDVRGEGDPPFEVDDVDGKELIAIGAAEEVAAPTQEHAPQSESVDQEPQQPKAAKPAKDAK